MSSSQQIEQFQTVLDIARRLNRESQATTDAPLRKEEFKQKMHCFLEEQGTPIADHFIEKAIDCSMSFPDMTVAEKLSLMVDSKPVLFSTEKGNLLSPLLSWHEQLTAKKNLFIQKMMNYHPYSDDFLMKQAPLTVSTYYQKLGRNVLFNTGSHVKEIFNELIYAFLATSFSDPSTIPYRKSFTLNHFSYANPEHKMMYWDTYHYENNALINSLPFACMNVPRFFKEKEEFNANHQPRYGQASIKTVQSRSDEPCQCEKERVHYEQKIPVIRLYMMMKFFYREQFNTIKRTPYQIGPEVVQHMAAPVILDDFYRSKINDFKKHPEMEVILNHWQTSSPAVMRYSDFWSLCYLEMLLNILTQHQPDDIQGYSLLKKNPEKGSPELLLEMMFNGEFIDSFWSMKMPVAK